MAAQGISSPDSFDAIYNHLKTDFPHSVPCAPPSAKPYDAKLSHSISSISVHPALEAVLHILNNDLPSAHFLCRHMQAAPAYEGMFVHGLLHQIEGDYRNAEAWYDGIQESDCFKHVWPGGLQDAIELVRDIENLRKLGVGDEMHLRERSWSSIDLFVEWCKQRFGTDSMKDATKAWVKPSASTSDIAAKMIVGGEGWREF